MEETPKETVWTITRDNPDAPGGKTEYIVVGDDNAPILCTRCPCGGCSITVYASSALHCYGAAGSLAVRIEYEGSFSGDPAAPDTLEQVIRHLEPLYVHTSYPEAPGDLTALSAAALFENTDLDTDAPYWTEPSRSADGWTFLPGKTGPDGSAERNVLTYEGPLQLGYASGKPDWASCTDPAPVYWGAVFNAPGGPCTYGYLLDPATGEQIQPPGTQTDLSYGLKASVNRPQDSRMKEKLSLEVTFTGAAAETVPRFDAYSMADILLYSDTTADAGIFFETAGGDGTPSQIFSADVLFELSGTYLLDVTDRNTGCVLLERDPWEVQASAPVLALDLPYGCSLWLGDKGMTASIDAVKALNRTYADIFAGGTAAGGVLAATAFSIDIQTDAAPVLLVAETGRDLLEEMRDPAAWTASPAGTLPPATIDDCLALNAAGKITFSKNIHAAPVCDHAGTAELCMVFSGAETARACDSILLDSRIEARISHSGTAVVGKKLSVRVTANVPGEGSLGRLEMSSIPIDILRNGADAEVPGTRKYDGNHMTADVDTSVEGEVGVYVKNPCTLEVIAIHRINIRGVGIRISVLLERDRFHVYGESAMLGIQVILDGAGFNPDNVRVTGTDGLVFEDGSPVSFAQAYWTYSGGNAGWHHAVMAPVDGAVGSWTVDVSYTHAGTTVHGRPAPYAVIDDMTGTLVFDNAAPALGDMVTATWDMGDTGGLAVPRFDTCTPEYFMLQTSPGIPIIDSQCGGVSCTAEVRAVQCGSFQMNAYDPNRQHSLGTAELTVEGQGDTAGISLQNASFHIYGQPYPVTLTLVLYPACDNGSRVFDPMKCSLTTSGPVLETDLQDSLDVAVKTENNWTLQNPEALQDPLLPLQYRAVINVQARMCTDTGDGRLSFSYGAASDSAMYYVTGDIQKLGPDSFSACPGERIEIYRIFTADPPLTRFRYPDAWDFQVDCPAAYTAEPPEPGAADLIMFITLDSPADAVIRTIEKCGGTTVDSVAVKAAHDPSCTARFTRDTVHSYSSAETCLEIAVLDCGKPVSTEADPEIAWTMDGKSVQLSEVMEIRSGGVWTGGEYTACMYPVLGHASGTLECTVTARYRQDAGGEEIIRTATASVYISDGIAADITAPGKELVNTAFGVSCTLSADDGSDLDRLDRASVEIYSEGAFADASASALVLSGSWAGNSWTGTGTGTEEGYYTIGVRLGERVLAAADIEITGPVSSVTVNGPDSLHVYGDSRPLSISLYVDGRRPEDGVKPLVELRSGDAAVPVSSYIYDVDFESGWSFGHWDGMMTARRDAQAGSVYVKASYPTADGTVCSDEIRVDIVTDIDVAVRTAPATVHVDEAFSVSIAVTSSAGPLTRAAGCISVSDHYRGESASELNRDFSVDDRGRCYVDGCSLPRAGFYEFRIIRSSSGDDAGRHTLRVVDESLSWYRKLADQADMVGRSFSGNLYGGSTLYDLNRFIKNSIYGYSDISINKDSITGTAVDTSVIPDPPPESAPEAEREEWCRQAYLVVSTIRYAFGKEQQPYNPDKIAIRSLSYDYYAELMEREQYPSCSRVKNQALRDKTIGQGGFGATVKPFVCSRYAASYGRKFTRVEARRSYGLFKYHMGRRTYTCDYGARMYLCLSWHGTSSLGCTGIGGHDQLEVVAGMDIRNSYTPGIRMPAWIGGTESRGFSMNDAWFYLQVPKLYG